VIERPKPPSQPYSLRRAAERAAADGVDWWTMRIVASDLIPDGLAGEILDRHALPYFREGDYGRGFTEAMAAVSSIVAKNAGVTLTGVSLPAMRQVRVEKKPGIFQLLLLLAAALFLLGTRRGRAMLPWLLLLMMSGGGRRGGGFGSFGGGGFGGFGGGMSGGGGAGRGF